jgi:hypothetical protein
LKAAATPFVVLMSRRILLQPSLISSLSRVFLFFKCPLFSLVIHLSMPCHAFLSFLSSSSVCEAIGPGSPRSVCYFADFTPGRQVILKHGKWRNKCQIGNRGASLQGSTNTENPSPETIIEPTNKFQVGNQTIVN